MTSINISIKKEAYEFLKKLKTGESSFSDIILSFKKEHNNAMRFFGALKDMDWSAKENDMKKIRESFSKRLK